MNSIRRRSVAHTNSDYATSQDIKRKSIDNSNNQIWETVENKKDYQINKLVIKI